MDSVLQTSLEALLLKATTSHNHNIDAAAFEAFCTLINKEKDGVHLGVKVLACQLPSGNEYEMLQTLNVLDTCMNRCGPQFQSEIGKFRFLNEMIKLVSPKYLGSHTPLNVKQKVLQIMYMWTIDYPKETKIKEAYDMLRKQGVIRECPSADASAQNANVIKRKQANSVFQDEEKSKILQKLLQSKDPEDIQAANWLIKSMVKEDDKRAELKSRRVSELESVQNNVRLLNEMLDSYKPGISSADELDLIRELHQSCERLRPNVSKLATDAQQGEKILADVRQVSDELSEIFVKFKTVFENNQPPVKPPTANSCLLDFDDSDSLQGASNCASTNGTTSDSSGTKPDMDVLCDIFTTSTISDPADVLQPTSVLCDKSESDRSGDNCKFKALEDLDVLSEHLLKENLQSMKRDGFTKDQAKIPMNLLTKLPETKLPPTMTGQTLNESLGLDLNYLLNNPKEEPKNGNADCSGDDVLVDISDEKMLETCEETPSEISGKIDLKLCDIFISLDSIKPSGVPPLTLLNEKNGINITLHFVKEKPREDVRVFVVTAVNKNEMALSNYLFQAVVPKGCKLKLQPPSANVLPPFNPFLPPSAITQIMLIACPDDCQIFLKFIVSYVMDGETYTEMGEAENLLMT